MNTLKLDDRLNRDCHGLGKIGHSLLLLHRNAGIAWFILVPQTDCIELVDVPASQQAKLLEDINKLSRFIRKHFDVDKLNVATIGNVVPQLHIHVIGRNQTDYCWPNPVWGTQCEEVYSDAELDRIRQLLNTSIEEFVGVE